MRDTGECSMVNPKRFPFSLTQPEELLMTTRFRPGMAAAVGALAATTLMLAACNSTTSTTSTSSTTPAGSTPSTAAAAPINLVASTNVWGDIAKQIGGDHVS